MTLEKGSPQQGPAVVLVPCAETNRLGCRLVRRAVELVAGDTPELAVAEAGACPRGRGQFVVAIDASQQCQASAALDEAGLRPSAVVSAPAVLARAGLVKPGVDVRARAEELSQALADAIREVSRQALAEARERRQYREAMAPVLARFGGIWSKVESLPPPDGAAPPGEATRVELLAKRSRNLFVKFDEIVPPAEWSEPHDLFQDALLCIAYACEGWGAGDSARWEQNLEKARVQLRPLLRRLQ